MTCPAPNCTATLGTNGIACSAHFKERVPGFLSAALFRNRKDRPTYEYLARQVAHAVRMEPYSA